MLGPETDGNGMQGSRRKWKLLKLSWGEYERGVGMAHRALKYLNCLSLGSRGLLCKKSLDKLIKTSC
jgi:hypothetical protein